MVAVGETMISRVVKILTTFQGGDESLSVAQIAARSEIPTATTYRLVRELVHWGILERDADGQIRTGLRLWELAARSSPQLRLRDRLLPIMGALQSAVKQHTHLTALDGTDIVYIERLSAKDGAVNITRIGSRLPAAVSAPGLVHAAFSSADVCDAILSAIPKPFTPFTPTRREQLAKVVEETRRSGIAVAEGWIHSDATGLAVPVWGPENKLVAALSLVVPRDSDLVTASVPALQAAAHAAKRVLRTNEEHDRNPQLNLLEYFVQQGTINGRRPATIETDE